MKYRSKVLQVYSNFAKMVKTKFSKHFKIFRSDNALEYTQYTFQAVLFIWYYSSTNLSRYLSAKW